MHIADRVTTRRDAAALTTFMALLRRALAAGLRAAARGGTPAPWTAGRSLAEWATLWEKLGRLADETERLNLDRKQAVLSGLGAALRPLKDAAMTTHDLPHHARSIT